MCLTLLIFTYLTRKSLCEIRYRDGHREVAAFMAYRIVSSNWRRAQARFSD
ncbi:type I toxin-antitoxin system Hok family toxin [Escherichia coli]|uniref:type I toxin-antitoxin system Hok family toxin n=1 Tax=Escherichia coli TaxID=562 RepID=UPI0024A65049|nr:type I toxin-antitoxin system Hok family toxin [Escherichia coli]